MLDPTEKDIAIAALRDRLRSTLDSMEKEKINHMILKLKRHKSSGFMTRKELADHYGISTWKLLNDIKSNTVLLDDLISSGWNLKKSGFYPKQVTIVQKHLGL